MPDTRPFVFVLMPFSPAFNNVYRSSIKPACEELGLRCERVDEQVEEIHIDEEIVDVIYQNIREADLLIADVTGHNPNVYYELGFSRALQKKIISISRTVNDLPFDIRNYPALAYGNKEKPDEEVDYHSLKERLKKRVENAIETGPRLDDNTPIVFSASRKLQGERLEHLIQGTESQASFLGLHFQWSLSDHESLLLDKLKRGVKLTYVVINPKNKALISRVAEMLSIRSEELQRECDDGLLKLERFYSQASEQGVITNLTILLSEKEPFGRYYIFDGREPYGTVIHTPYSFKMRSSHSPSYMYPSRSEVAAGYIQSCQKLIEAAKPAFNK